MSEESKINTVDDNEDDVTWSCRFHPTDSWHEVGCPHQSWTAHDLQLALITAKKSIRDLVNKLLGTTPT